MPVQEKTPCRDIGTGALLSNWWFIRLLLTAPACSRFEYERKKSDGLRNKLALTNYKRKPTTSRNLCDLASLGAMRRRVTRLVANQTPGTRSSDLSWYDRRSEGHPRDLGLLYLQLHTTSHPSGRHQHVKFGQLPHAGAPLSQVFVLGCASDLLVTYSRSKDRFADNARVLWTSEELEVA